MTSRCGPAIYSDVERWVHDLSRTDLVTGHWLPFHSSGLIAHAVAEFVAGSGDGD
ncbi:hypothetical protein [Tomitella gaofuii]|uniref:hypothetical protein n=1 Tax=Tomitella gaofuii TaxID=2760083 RepID=UPI001F33F51D|nr:hypothetical protein [Tomitella gaofuii]